MKTFLKLAQSIDCFLVPIKYHSCGHTSKGYDIVNADGYILFSFIPYNDSKANIWKVIRKVNTVEGRQEPYIIYGSAREVASRKDFYRYSERSGYRLSGFSGSLVNA